MAWLEPIRRRARREESKGHKFRSTRPTKLSISDATIGDDSFIVIVGFGNS